MTAFRRLPIRARLAAGFALTVALVLAVLGFAVHVITGAVLLDELDTGLRTRAATIEANGLTGLHSAPTTRGLIESHEAFAQVIGPRGDVTDASVGVAGRLLPSAATDGLEGASFFERRLPGVANVARLLAVPVTTAGQRDVIVVGASMSDRNDALRLVTRLFAIGGPIAVAAAAASGWLVAGAALRPVERMRRQAAAISSSRPDQRLDVPEAEDELRRLAVTLNAMLERLNAAMDAERQFLDHASHELRTPLTALKLELDLAASRPRGAEELTAALASASEEADRLARMADDLLLLSRAHAGHAPVRTVRCSLADVLGGSARSFRRRAQGAAIDLAVRAPDRTVVLDPDRVRQAVDNLVDNALRFARRSVFIRGEADDGTVRIVVEDDGPGFPEAFRDQAFEPFTRVDGRSGGSVEGAGLGLAIVRMVAESHGGYAAIENRREGGGRVVLELPSVPVESAGLA
jgi:signal transduction histidine kinase